MLTDVKVRTTKPGDKDKKLYDELGLFLLVKPSGSKLWRFKYQFAGKEKLLAIGAYPDVTLQQARKARSELREQLLQGIDPAEVRKKRKEEPAVVIDTFGEIGREWMQVKGGDWSDSHRERNQRLIFKDLAPLCERPIREITARELLSVLRVIEARGVVDTAHRARQAAGSIDVIGKMRALVPAAKLYAWRDKADPFSDGRVHAKVAVADGRICFITSANLTGYAMEKNMEAGVLLTGGNISKILHEHLSALVNTSIVSLA